ncbi:MAG: class I SAM-dependent methyltransferase [Caulobacteraceae bacterium]|nr:class I SAM-dependent methyltransferase [Caulobacteraceae bacterium]
MKPIALAAALVTAGLLAASALVVQPAIAQPVAVPSNIAAAVADPGRPKDDLDRDALRHPAEVLAFAGVKPGDSVADLLPGGGYFTRIFSKAVGPSGHVYAIVPAEIAKAFPKSVDGVKALAADPAYANVTVLVEPIEGFSAPAPLDLVWTAQNYHDLHDPFMGPADLAKVNGAIFAALKPGGTYLVLDHVAEAGSGLRDTNTLHRIDPAVVKTEVTAAGFVLAGQSGLLHNPGDAHIEKVFDPSIRGRTDQFIFKFRKPAG